MPDENGCEMVRYKKVVEGIFSKKRNRFVAEIWIDGKREDVHIKNTGRLKEILQPGAVLALETATNPKRKTRYSIIAAKKGERWINIDSQVPNQVVHEAINRDIIDEFQGITNLKREATYQGSRFDFSYKLGNTLGFIEVKGVTLEDNGLAMFPDAPTIRGSKHVETLMQAKEDGYEATILFVIQMKGCYQFTPYKEMDPLFYQLLQAATKKGVRLLAYDCHVSESTIELDKPIPILL